MGLTGNVKTNVSFKPTTTVGLVTMAGELAINQDIALGNGVAIDQADVLFSQSASIAGGGTLSLDLKGGGLVDPFGAAIAPAKVKYLYIFSKKANTTVLTLFGDANGVPILGTPATTVSLKPGGKFEFADPSLAGVPVTVGTGDIVKIVNAAGAAAVVDIVIVGTST